MQDRIGQQLGNYQLLRLLGRGGFADVYLGEHMYLKSLAALKVLHTKLEDEDAQQFVQEAQLLASLSHPHIVHILDFSVQEGVPFLVMEYAPGGTLRTRHRKQTQLPLDTITYFLNSILAVFPSLLIILAISVSAAFALEVMTWRLRNPVLLLFLAGIMVPLQLVLLPLFTIYFQASLIDTRWALIITYTAFGLPLSVFLMAGFFKSVPREVMETAVLDGASIYKVFYRVALPMVANGLVTIALVQFFYLWNDLLFSLTFIVSDSNRTIQTGLLNFTGQYGQVDWGPTFAAISLAVIPTLILYLVLNQQVIKGLASGSLKG